jgi:molybdate transport repressor ModE-like protein
MDRIEALRLFVRLAEQGSFTAAARDLKVKQSTASKWIAELEKQFGSSLVERTTRSFHLTDAGHRLNARAREILAAFDATTEELTENGKVPMGRVRVSVPVVFGRLFVAPLLVEFAKKQPTIDLEIVLGDRYVNLVDEGVDLAIRVGVPADTTARGHKLVESRRFLVASPAYLRARGRPTTPRSLRDHECLLHGQATATTIWRFSRGAERERPVPVTGRISVNNSEIALAMARDGLGVALLADWLVGRDLENKRLVRLLEDYEAPPAPVYLLTPPGQYTPTAVRALREYLARALPVRIAKNT